MTFYLLYFQVGLLYLTLSGLEAQPVSVDDVNNSSDFTISSLSPNINTLASQKNEPFSSLGQNQTIYSLLNESTEKPTGTQGPVKDEERPLWFKDAIKDIAYYLRAHKFNEYDRRYNRNGSGVESPKKAYMNWKNFLKKSPGFPNDIKSELKFSQPSAELFNKTNFKYFPKPPLRALHWEVNKYCEPSFFLCVDYLRKKLKHVAIKREDDTSVVIQYNKWSRNATEQIGLVDMECKRMLQVDDLVAPPFEGPLERYQWRTTASYFMCWYTMSEVPDLKYFQDDCDNFAYCMDMSLGPYNDDPRADDKKPFACAQYSFCPDPCCANKHLQQMDSCWNDGENPCFRENSAGQRECLFNRTQNTDFSDLIVNRINVTCKCPQQGFIWSSFYGLCVDIDECVTLQTHGCAAEGQACMNLPGSFTCVCKWGYTYNEKDKKCIVSDTLAEIKLGSEQRKKEETKNRWQIFIRTVVRLLGKSSSSKVLNSCFTNIIFAMIFFVL